MKQIVTTGIILKRTDFGEADRIITLITPDHGKVRLLAKGVRRVKSKLAGGIELFSVSHITYALGRGELGTLISTRLITHYRHIVEDIERTLLGYELIKQLDKATEDEPESAYFSLLETTFAALDDHSLDLVFVRLWFACQLVRLSGRMPNLETDPQGHRLEPEQQYHFSAEHMSFMAAEGKGTFGADHIKFLRLAFACASPKILARVAGGAKLAKAILPIVLDLQRL